MSILAYVLGGFVFIYTVIYGVKCFLPIQRYMTADKKGVLKNTIGTVVKKTAEENKAVQGIMINICLPVYEWFYNGEPKECQSSVRYRNVKIGQEVEIKYDEGTGEAWATKDIPMMKKNLLMRVGMMLGLLLLLVVTEIVL